MKSSNVIQLDPCPKCGGTMVFASYKENRRYKYKCVCGQYFEFNAPSQFAADMIYNCIRCGKRTAEKNAVSMVDGHIEE